MRVWTLPVVALTVMIGTYSDEPTERQMHRAFADTLSAQVQTALDAVAEIGGSAALQQVKASGADRFRIERFRKIDCSRIAGGGYRCAFAVDVAVMTGILHRVMDGEFHRDGAGLVYASRDT